MRTGAAFILLALAAIAPRIAHADYGGTDAYEEFGKHVREAEEVAPLKSSVFGEQVSLYSGSTEFDVTDVSLPGNNALPVELQRRLEITDHRNDPNGVLASFGDWNIDVPYISGTFTQQNGWTLQPSGSTNRCSDNIHLPYTAVPIYGNAPYGDIWDGNRMHLPGAGDEELLVNNQAKSPAYASHAQYPWVSKSNYKFGCLANAQNGLAGESFVALSPAGVATTFDWAVTQQAPSYVWQYNTKYRPVGIPRITFYLLATRVRDRFGNWVAYTYGGAAGNQLTSITSSDGRSIALTWTGSTITSVKVQISSNPLVYQTWSYAYTTDSKGKTHLSTVTRPDGSRWTYTINSGSLFSTKNDWPSDPDWGNPNYRCQQDPDPNSGSFVYTVGAPSGASATYNFIYDRHQRTYIPKGCPGDLNYYTHYPSIYDFFDNYTLVSKTVNGPGLATQTWSYYYAEPSGTYFIATAYWDPLHQPYILQGPCPTCALSKVVTVTGPTSITKYTFGVKYAVNEGQLLNTEIDSLSSAVLKTITNAYVSDTNAVNEPFANVAGYTLLPNSKHPMDNRQRPTVITQIGQDGATFTSTVNSFDAFARTTSETASSSLGYSKATLTSYYDQTTLWALGQTAETTINGIVADQSDFYGSNALPGHHWVFGKMQSYSEWNTDGTLAAVLDGLNHTTTLSSWYRGIPRSVQYADNTSESAVVNDAGWITAVTDENGYATGYGYDAMGRVASVVYPTGDDVAWNTTTRVFQQIGSAEYGIPAGHWKQTVHAGNGYAVTYFDALWRPLVSDNYDYGNVAATRSVSVKRYDAGGRSIFASYPLSSLTSYTSPNTGVHTSYDALDRVTEVDQDSELGTLQTKTAYLTGFTTKVTNPRGKAVTTSYLTYDEPSTSWPVSITAPAGETTAITRDVFGKPLTLVRSGTLTRSFVYDSYQQLCKRIEPETSATVFAYDGAGNLQWSAGGLNLPNTGSCDTSTAYSSGRRVDNTYYQRNWIQSVTYPDGFSNTSYTYYPDGALQTETANNAGHPVATTYSYDKRRLLTGESVSIPGTSPLSIAYGHDVNGHVASTTYPDNRYVGFVPNALGQTTQVGSYATSVSYYPNGAIQQFTYGNGAVHTTTQNTRQLPDRMTDAKSGTAAHDDGYDYDEDADVAAITDYVNSSRNRDMTYDDLDRLTQTISPMFGGDNKAVYSYDALDNLLAARVGNLSNYNYQYDLGNHLAALKDPNTDADLVTYVYDAQGNLSNKNNQILQFDMGDRLRDVTGAESYLYDASGRRVQKTQNDGTVVVSDYSKAGALMYRGVPASMVLTDYFYLSGDLLAKVTNNTSQVIGDIDGAPTVASPSVGGWACSTGLTQSINVELYVGGPAVSGTHIGTYTANQPSEPAIGTACQASGSNYRFAIPLSVDTRNSYTGQLIYMNGDSPVGGDDNQLNDSGVYTVPPNPWAPDAPASVTVPSTSTTSSVTVSWAPSLNTTQYVLQQSLNGGGWTQIYSGASISYALNLDDGSYQYRVEACNINGCSAFTTSNTLIVAIIPAPPASITVPSSNYTGSFPVSWSSSLNASSYVLQQSFNSGAWTQIYSGGNTSTTATVSVSGNYQYRVQACGANGCSGYTTSIIVVVTFPPVLSGPSSSTSGTYTLNWTAVSGATSYQLMQKLNSGSWVLVYNSSGRSWTSSGVGSGTYYYLAYACNVGGCSAASNQITVVVHRIPDPPVTVTVPQTVTRGIPFNASWSASIEATSYTLQYTDLFTQRVYTVYTGPHTATSVMIVRLTSVQFAAQACNANGCSAWTNAPTDTDVEPPGGQPAPASSSP